MARRFLGTHPAKADQRGRVAVPADFRKVFRALGSGEVHLVRQLNAPDAHLCFTEQGFDRLVQQIADSPRSRSEKDALRRYVIGRAKLIEQDDLGRMVIPEPIRREVGIEREVLFVGLGDYFELRAGVEETLAEGDLAEGRALAEDLELDGLH